MLAPPLLDAPRSLQLTRWVLDPDGFQDANSTRYGPLYGARISPTSAQPLYFLSEPKALQYLLGRDSGKEFSAPGEVNAIVEPLLGRNGLLMASGDEHRKRRQLVVPPFHGDRLKSYGQTVQAITEEFIANWRAGEKIDVRSAMQKITMRVILQVVFGVRAGDRYAHLERDLGARLDTMSSRLTSALLFVPVLRADLGPWSPGGRARRLGDRIDAELYAELRERRAAATPGNEILSMLIAARDEDGNGMSDLELHDELMTLLVAGHETTATMLTWVLYWVHRFPEVKAKLLAELSAVADPTDASQFLQLPYLAAVCNEAMRLYPVAMLTFPRQVETSVQLCGYHLEPGALVIGSIYSLHRREDLYPHPEQFRPERFLERQFSPYEFMPFGGGVRRCAGMALAQYELKIVTATLLTRLDFAPLDQRPLGAARRGLTLGLSRPVRLQVRAPRAAQPSTPAGVV